MNGTARSVAIVVALGAAIAAVLAFKQAAAPSPSASSVDKPPTAASPTPSKTPLPKLIEIGSESCIPCRAMQPVLASLRTKYPDRLEVEFIDVAREPERAEAFKIQLIPTQVFLDEEGKELARHTGFLAEGDIVQKFASLGIRL